MKLLDEAEDTGAGDVFPVDSYREPHRYQVQITGTASVNIEGRAASDAPWVVLATVTETGSDAVNALPHMRANVTAATGATISVWLV